MLTKKKFSCFILLIFLAALLIRVIYIFQILEFPLTEYFTKDSIFDQCEFDGKAVFIASGNWLGGTEVFVKEPLYFYFLAFIYRVFTYNHYWVYLIQAISTSLGVVLIYKISSQIFNRPTGIFASFILAFYSISIFYDVQLLRVSLITFLFILLFYLLLEALKGKRNFTWFIAGAVLGLSILTRVNILPPFIIMFILFRVSPFKKAVRCASIFTAGVFLILLPVLARNYVTSDYKNISISTKVDAFWVGNVYNASGVDFLPNGLEYRKKVIKSEGSLKKMSSLFLKEVRKRPKEYLKLYGRKIWMFFNGYEAPSNTNYYLYREEFPTILRWPLFNFRFIGALAILGIFLSLFRERRPNLLYIFLIVLSGSVILFHIQSRFRLPAVPFFIVFSSYSIYFIFDKLRKRAFLKSIALVGFTLIFYIILKPDLTYAGFRPRGETIRNIDRTNLAVAYIDSDKEDPSNLKRALKQCDLAIKDDRKFSLGYRIKGYIYFLEKRYSASIDEYKKAIVYSNRDPFLYNELAGVYYEESSYDKAFVYIERALHFSPEHKGFKKNLDMIPTVAKR